MSKRILLGVLASAVVLSAVPGHAAPRPVKKSCNLVTDVSGDATEFVVSPAGLKAYPSVDTLDVISGDLASDAKWVTGVIRVKALRTTEPSAPAGMTWRLSYKLNNWTLFLRAVSNGSGAVRYEYGTQIVEEKSAFKREGDATGVWDTVKNEIRISALVVGHQKIKPVPGLKAVSTDTETGRNRPEGETVSPHPYRADHAGSSSVYVMGRPSCVTPSK